MEITRSKTILVCRVEKNDYGDLVFTDEEGGEYKIGKARISHFENILVAGATVQLNFAPNPHKAGTEYIYNAVQGKPSNLSSERLQSLQKPLGQAGGSEIAPQERGMWQKEVGEWMRSGKLREWSDEKKIDITFAKALTTVYWAGMMSGLGIDTGD